MSKTITPLMDARLTAEGAERGRLKAVAERDALAQRCAELEHSLAVKEEFYQDALHSHMSLVSQRDILRAEVERLRAEQPGTVAVPRGLLDRVNSLLQYAGSTGDDAQHGEAVSRMRALLDGGEA